MIHPKRLGLAFGIIGAFLYLGCMLLMWTVGKEGTVLFFNSVIHGIDVSSVVRMQVPLEEVLIGIIETFILCWLTGAGVAVFYNLFSHLERRESETPYNY